MNKKRIIIPLMLFVSLLVTPLFSSCDKDTNCYLNVLVRDDATHAPISMANVTITSGSLHDEGVTNTEGIYATHFSAPVILTVKAVLPGVDEFGGERRGETSVRLKDGETVTATITMTSEIYY